jgi:hypothetical protein
MADRTYAVTLEVPHPARACRWVAASFDEHLAAQVAVIPPVCSAELVTEVRRGRDGLRLRIAVTVRAADLGQAVSIAWEALEAASEGGAFDLAGAVVEAGPVPLTLSPHRSWAGPSRELVAPLAPAGRS